MALTIAILRAAAMAGTGSSSTSMLGARGWLFSMLIQNSSSREPLATSFCNRSRHTMALSPEPSIVPEVILKELNQIESSLATATRLDGTRRASLPFSAPILPAALPPHALEPGLPTLDAHVRPRVTTGGTACKWLQRAGRVPGRVYGLPPEAGSELLLHFDERELSKMLRGYGRTGITARVLELSLVAPTSLSSTAASESRRSSSAGVSSSEAVTALGRLRVKPTGVQLNAVTQRIEGFDLLYCPQDRVVRVDVPVRMVNDDLAPGVKKGGWFWVMKRTVQYKALGSSIPPYVEVNVRHMDLEQDLLVRQLPIPPGTKIYEKDFNSPVLRCTTDVGKD